MLHVLFLLSLFINLLLAAVPFTHPDDVQGGNGKVRFSTET
jgi:hypothetical protein